MLIWSLGVCQEVLVMCCIAGVFHNVTWLTVCDNVGTLQHAKQWDLSVYLMDMMTVHLHNVLLYCDKSILLKVTVGLFFMLWISTPYIIISVWNETYFSWPCVYVFYEGYCIAWRYKCLAIRFWHHKEFSNAFMVKPEPKQCTPFTYNTDSSQT